jgi:outer membrane lipopolysaccharide assembly protein LptE/RlpB
VFVQNDIPDNQTALQIKNILLFSNINIVNSSPQAATILHLYNETLSQQASTIVTTYSNQLSQIHLKLTLKYSLMKNHQLILGPKTISVSSYLNANPNQMLATENEQLSVYQDMRREIIHQLINQICLAHERGKL